MLGETLVDPQQINQQYTNYSEKCKICSQMPEDLRDNLQMDYQSKMTFEELCTKYNSLLKERGVDLVINPTNIHTHFKKHKHFDIDGYQTKKAQHEIEVELKDSLAITDEKTLDGKFNGQTFFEIVDADEDEIKPIAKSLLKSKGVRLERLYRQLAHDEALSGGMQNLKVHREIQMVEDSAYRIAAALVKDFYLDSDGKYDKSLYVVQELGRKIFLVLQQQELEWNGIPEKQEALDTIRTILAELFDEYEKEIDMVRPE